jgi:sugar phosphate isomerase/epimerase
MRFQNPAHPGRSVRLAYCLNLHPADTLAGLFEGLRTITLPLRERLASGRAFGVGMYVPGALAAELERADDWRALKGFLEEHDLDPFTWNAFPYGGFGAEGLKARVFEPAWYDPERTFYTQRVAHLAGRMARRPSEGEHVSVSTHTGWHSSRSTDEAAARKAYQQLRYVELLLSQRRGTGDVRVVLSLEPEPRANLNDTRELAAQYLGPLRLVNDPPGLGTCLDTCHAAVEFEDPFGSLVRATESGAPLGKLQFTSALCLRPERRADVDALLALDEPRYLHQVTARAADGELLRVGDLPELRAALAGPEGERWWLGAELRCHFHVPVDLERLSEGPLSTTREHADATLAAALAHPERWGSHDLHVEIETYTWDVLPRAARGPGELVDGLEREYLHVLQRLAAAGWTTA